MSFKVGDRVVCFYFNWDSGDKHLCKDGEKTPEFGKIYTIRSIEKNDYLIGIRLDEIRNKPRLYAEGFSECCFYVKYFRKLDTDFTEQVIRELLSSPNLKPEELEEYFSKELIER